MLGIILGILKVIALIILYILLFLIFLIFLILVLPLSYKMKILYDKKLDLSLKVNYFLYIFRFSLTYKEELDYRLKVFNFTLFSSDEALDDENFDSKVSDDKSSEDEILGDKDSNDKVSDYEKEVFDKSLEDRTVKDNTVVENNTELDKIEDKQRTTVIEKSDKKESLEPILEEKKEEVVEEELEKIPEKKRGKRTRKKRSFNISAFIKKLVNNIRTRVVKIKKTLKNIDKRKSRISRSIKDERNRLAIKTLWILLVKLIKHILPRRIKGKIIFGFSDPATTANAVGYISLVPPSLYKNVDIIPMFNSEIMDVNLDIRGRIHLIYLLYIGICAYFDRNIKRLYKLYRKKKLF